MVADIESKYCAVLADEENSGSGTTTSTKWNKTALVIIGGSCLWLLALMSSTSSSSSSSSSSQNVPAMSTSLIGLSSSPVASGPLRSKMLPGAPPLAANLPGQSPFKELAISAVGAVNGGKGMRDVSVQAFRNLGEKSKQIVAKMSGEVSVKAEEMAGVTEPFGFFDPAGLVSKIPEGKLLFYREVEIKHGRVGMLASLGLLVGEQFHPLFGGNIDVPSYIAFQETPLQDFWPAVVAAIAIPELVSVFTFEDPRANTEKLWEMKTGRVPGDFGFDPLGLKPKTPEAFRDMQNKELNNGRLAMLAAAGILMQEVATGTKVFGY